MSGTASPVHCGAGVPPELEPMVTGTVEALPSQGAGAEPLLDPLERPPLLDPLEAKPLEPPELPEDPLDPEESGGVATAPEQAVAANPPTQRRTHSPTHAHEA
jgi:hypothetical protein